MTWDEKLQKEILTRNPCMNNTKWIEFAEVFYNQKFNGCKIKFLLANEVYNFTNFGILGDSYCDCMTGGFYFKEIEWVFVPKTFEIERFNRNEKLKSEYKENEIFAFAKMLDSVGNFPYHIDDKGFTIYGYK